MKTFAIAIAAIATLGPAALVNTQAAAAPGYYSPGKMKPVGPGGFKPGQIKPVGPGGFKPHKPIGPIGGLKPPESLSQASTPFPPGAGWGPGKKHGHWHGNQWGYAAAGLAGVATVAYFARPVYTAAYEDCEWLRVQTAYGWRWRPYC